MDNSIATVPGLEIFALEIEESCPIIEDTRTTQEDLKGRQGGKLKVVIPDPGRTVVKKGGVPTIGAGGDITNTDIVEFEKEFEVAVATNAGSLDSLEETVDIDSFEKEIVAPRAPELGAAIQEDIIASSAFVTDSVFVADGTSETFDGYDLLSKMGGSLMDSRCGAEKVGYMSGSVYAKIAKTGLKLFNENAISGELYREAKIGKYANVMWKYASMPVITVGTLPASTTVSAQPTEGSDTIVLASSNISNSTTIKAGTAFTVASVKKCDVLGHVTGEDKAFVVLEDATGESGTITLKVGEINAKGAHKNVSALPASNAAVTWLQTSGKSYAVVFAFQKGNIEMSSVKLNNSGLKEVSAPSPSGKIIMSAVVHGDVNRVGTYRFDAAYLAGMVDSRRVAVVFIQLD